MPRFIFAVLSCQCLVAAAAPPTTITVDSLAPVGRTDPTRFASFSFDFTALWGVQRTAIPFTDDRLRRLARNLAPAFVRFGGSLQDRAVTAFAGVAPPPPPPAGLLQLQLNESTFDGLVDFADATGLDLVYGLNAAVGRQTANGPAAWDSANALAPVLRAAARGARMPVIEIGNEVNVFNCSSDNLAKMSASQLAAQYAITAEAVRALLPGVRIWGSDSSITGDVVGQCHDWYGDDILGFNRDLFGQPGFAALLDAHTWHYYSQDSRNSSSTAEFILSDEYQSRLSTFEVEVRAIRDAAAPNLPIVMGETASYWAGGRANVSNRFASGFWYIPQLSTLAARSYLTHIRQDLAGGDYGLLDLVLDDNGVVVDFTANPDYFTHALYQRLVAGVVLSVNASAPASAPRVRVWAACAARAGGGANGGITIIYANFDATPAPVEIAVTGGGVVGDMRSEYFLTAGNAALGLASKEISLNGAILSVGPDLSLPTMQPTVSPTTSPLVFPPLSYGFVTIDARAPACMQ